MTQSDLENTITLATGRSAATGLKSIREWEALPVGDFHVFSVEPVNALSHVVSYTISRPIVSVGPSLTIQPMTFGTSGIEEMEAEIEKLQGRVATLEEEVSDLKSSIPLEVIVLRTLSREQAKAEIHELFQSGETLFYSDIARRLRIDLPLVVEICQELEEEGEVQVDANSV